LRTAVARSGRGAAASPLADPARVTTGVLLATAPAASGPAALLPWRGTTLLGRLLDQLVALGISDLHVIARTAHAARVTEAVAGRPVTVHATSGPPDDLAAIAGLAGAGAGGVVLAEADLVTQDEALAALVADTRLPTGVLASITRTGWPFTGRMRLRGGRVVSAATPYHTVRAPNAVFLGVLKLAGADRGALADTATRLQAVLRDGVPDEWEAAFEEKVARWRGALARRARGLAPPDDPLPGAGADEEPDEGPGAEHDEDPGAVDDEAAGARPGADHDEEADALPGAEHDPAAPASPAPPSGAAPLRADDEAELRLRAAALHDDMLALVVCGLVRAGVRVGNRRLRGLAWVRPRTPAQLAHAAHRVATRDEDAARRRFAVKGNDGFFTTHFVSPYSQYIARWAAHHGWTPDAVTLLSLGVGAAAAGAFATGERAGLVAGAVLLQAAFTLDCVDGQLARYTRRFSRFGAWLDAIGDRGKEYMVFAGLALGAAQAGDDVWLLAGAALALQTARHAADFCFGDAVRQEAPVPVFPPLEQSSDIVRRAGRPAAAARAVPPAPTVGRRVRARLRAVDRSRRGVWAKKLLAFPIGERFAVISLTAALLTPRTTFVVLLSWGGVAAVYMNAGRVLRSYGRRGGHATAAPVDHNAPRRDDGPLARALGKALGPRPALPLAALGVGGLLAGAAASGARASWAVVAGGVGWLVLTAGASSGRPLGDRLDWSVPPLLRVGEYAGLLWIGATADALPATFALLCAITYHHYDTVYRWRQLGELPARRLRDAAGGWDGRLVAATGLAAARVTPRAFSAAAIVLSGAFAADSARAWTVARRNRDRTAYEGYEGEED
jgi:hypothetical protein